MMSDAVELDLAMSARKSGAATRLYRQNIAGCLDGRIGAKFLQPDGSITRETMPDFLHLTAAGYQIWADAISPKLAELMK